MASTDMLTDNGYLRPLYGSRATPWCSIRVPLMHRIGTVRVPKVFRMSPVTHHFPATKWNITEHNGTHFSESPIPAPDIQASLAAVAPIAGTPAHAADDDFTLRLRHVCDRRGSQRKVPRRRVTIQPLVGTQESSSALCVSSPCPDRHLESPPRLARLASLD